MKMERLIGILSILLQKEKVTAPELAEQFEVSRRTIQRDIESLCRAGIPISTTQGAGGGISIMEGYRVDRTVLTDPEMQAILAGLRSLDSVSGTRRYAQLMEKLSAGTGGLVPGGAHMLILVQDQSAAEDRAHPGGHRAALHHPFYLFLPQRGIGADGGALLPGVPLVHLVRVGLVQDPGGFPPVQTEPHDGARRRGILCPSFRASARPYAGAHLSGQISGHRSL